MATHHSVSDWDMSGTWSLDSSTYVSSPSSIRFLAGAGATCKKSEVWNLPQGMIITYAKAYYNWGLASADCGFALSFRNQATSGAGLSGAGYATAGYTVAINVYTIKVYYYRDGSTIGNTAIIAKPTYANVWNKYRLTWWSDTGGAGLIVRLEYFDGTNWVKMVNDFNDPTDKYKGSTVNRISIASYYNYNAWYDDTEIWSV